MARYEVTSPDGQKYEITAPDNATDQEVMAYAQSQWQQQPSAPPKKPALSGSMDLLTRLHKNLTDYNPGAAVIEPALKMATGAVAKPVADVAGLYQTAKGYMTGQDTEPAKTQANVMNAMTYQPRTAVGQSSLNPLNAIPNAIGAVVGGASNAAADFVGGGAEADTPRGMAANAVREVIPQALSIAGAKYTPKAVSSANKKVQLKDAAKEQAAIARGPKEANIVEAKNAGFKLPPSEAGSSKAIQAVEGIAGRGKLVDEIENANAKRATQIIHDDLGLPAHVPLTKGALEEVINTSGKTYEKIRAIDQPFVMDKKYLSDITNLNAKVAAARRNKTTWNPEFATIMSDMKKASRSPDEAVDLMKSLRAESSANYAAVERANVSKPNQQALAKFQKEAANHLEDMVHRNLERMDRKDLSMEFLEARKMIAKSKTLEKVLDENGVINSEKLGKLQEKGAYMSGEMAKVAKFGRAFPDVAGKPKPYADVPLTAWEGMFGAGGMGAGMVNPLGFAALAFPASRLAGREFLKSNMGQNMVGMPKPYAPGTLSDVMRNLNQLSPEAQQAIAYPLLMQQNANP